MSELQDYQTQDPIACTASTHRDGTCICLTLTLQAPWWKTLTSNGMDRHLTIERHAPSYQYLDARKIWYSAWQEARKIARIFDRTITPYITEEQDISTLMTTTADIAYEMAESGERSWCWFNALAEKCDWVPAVEHEIFEINEQAFAALERMLALNNRMMQETNHAESAWSTETIFEMNDAPIEARRVLDMLTALLETAHE